MSLWLQENQRVKIHKLENKGNYSQANLSSSRKNTDGNGYSYSDWGFVRFVGKAHSFMSQNVKEGDILLLKKAIFSKESYMKDGAKQYPKSPQLVVFECELYRKGEGKVASDQEDVVVPDEDDIPF